MDGRGKKSDGAESRLARRWAGVPTEQPLSTQEGEQVRVLFPGLVNPGPGPDFLGAVLATERGRIVRGDVEVHQATSGWRAHGHGADPRYARVVLHVVGKDDQGAPTELPMGGRAPVLVLAPDLAARSALSNLTGGQAGPCAGCRVTEPEQLKAQGAIRFTIHTRRWMRRIAAAGPEQALYQGLLETLGVGPNRPLYARLGAALSWTTLQRILTAHDWSRLTAQALLLGAGGCLALESAAPKAVAPDSWQELRRRWAGLQHPVVIAAQEWRRSGTRPAAQPWVRLLGAAALLVRWREAGLSVAVASLGSALERPLTRLRSLFTVAAEEAELGLPWAALGPGRADSLVVNLLLPYQAAQAELRSDAGLKETALRSYRDYPGLEADTVVRATAARLGLEPKGLTACQQQGLHHLSRWYCARGRQARCPLRRGD